MDRYPYPFWWSSPRFEAMLGAPAPYPVAFVQLHSAFIHTLGVDAAVAEAAATLGELVQGGVAFTPSRADVYVDTQGWQPQIEDFQHFACRAVRRRMFANEREEHGHGYRLTGFTFGRRDIVARIYDKTVELRTRGQDWPKVLWRDAEPDQSVWRVEFQFRRDALAHLGVGELSALMARRQGLWEYATSWLTLRRPTADSNRRRWPLAKVWEELSRAVIGDPCSPLVRERVLLANETRLVRGLVGYASSIAATLPKAEPDMHDAFRFATPRAQHYLEKRGITFPQIVHEKRRTRIQPQRSGQGES